MAARIDRETEAILQGTLDMLVLRALQLEPMHGWGITERIEQWSEEVLSVGQGTLYPALYRLEANGWIAAEWKTSDKGKRARYYRLTARGRKHLAGEQSRWDAFARAMRLLLAPAENPR